MAHNSLHSALSKARNFIAKPNSKTQQLKKKKHEKEFVSNVGTWSHAPHVL